MAVRQMSARAGCLLAQATRRCSGKAGGGGSDGGKEKIRTWRAPWPELSESWQGVLGLMRGEKPERSGLWTIKLATLRPERLRSDAIREAKIRDQTPLPKRLAALGPDLAAAHFYCFRGAAVKMTNSDKWVRVDKSKKTIPLPNVFTEGLFVEMVDCENMLEDGLIYEGLGHLESLDGLKWLSLKGNKNIDDWGVDRVVGLTNKTLEYINLNGCNVTHRCLSALYKVDNLKMIELSAFQITEEFETACAMLEAAKPGMLIRLV